MGGRKFYDTPVGRLRAEALALTGAMYHVESVQLRLLRVRMERQILNSMHRDQLYYSLLSELYLAVAPDHQRKYTLGTLRSLDGNQNLLLQQQSLKNFGERPLTFRTPIPELPEEEPDSTSDEDKVKYLEVLTETTEGSTSFSEVLNRVSGLLTRIHELKSQS